MQPNISSDAKERSEKRKPNKSDSQACRKKRKTSGKKKLQIVDSDEEQELRSDDEDLGNQTPMNINNGPVRRSRRTNSKATGTYAESDEEEGDIEMIPPSRTQRSPSTITAPELGDLAPSEIELDVDEEEAKPKPILELKYQGFNISGRCLCVVVEPWPPIKAASRTPIVAPLFSNASRAPSMARPGFTSSDQRAPMHREGTPLFLPDLDRGRSETPAPSGSGRFFPPVPLFNDAIVMDEDSDEDGLMTFSQSLNYGDHGAMEVDDEIDGAIFFGDADEAREL